MPSRRYWAQTALDLHTSGPFRREPGKVCGARQVMALGSPSPVGVAEDEGAKATAWAGAPEGAGMVAGTCARAGTAKNKEASGARRFMQKPPEEDEGF